VLAEEQVETFFSADFKQSELAVELIRTGIRQQSEESLVNSDLIAM